MSARRRAGARGARPARRAPSWRRAAQQRTVLRRALNDGNSVRELAREAGIPEARLQIFRAGGRPLGLDLRLALARATARRGGAVVDLVADVFVVTAFRPVFRLIVRQHVAIVGQILTAPAIQPRLGELRTSDLAPLLASEDEMTRLAALRCLGLVRP